MPTTNSNFVAISATISGAATPVVLAGGAQASLATAQVYSGTILDKTVSDLSSAGFAKNGAFLLALAASTPVTVDLTNISAAASANAGDTSFATAFALIFNNVGLHDVVITPGASDGFLGPLGGTAPSFTVPAGTKTAWPVPAAGFPITGLLKNLKFDPGGNACEIGMAIGGA